jgi:hypothetical protein
MFIKKSLGNLSTLQLISLPTCQLVNFLLQLRLLLAILLQIIAELVNLLRLVLDLLVERLELLLDPLISLRLAGELAAAAL